MKKKNGYYDVCLKCHRIFQILYYNKTISVHSPHFEGYSWSGPIKCYHGGFYNSHPIYKYKKPNFIK